jgi:hypothetical protein
MLRSYRFQLIQSYHTEHQKPTSRTNPFSFPPLALAGWFFRWTRSATSSSVWRSSPCKSPAKPHPMMSPSFSKAGDLRRFWHSYSRSFWGCSPLPPFPVFLAFGSFCSGFYPPFSLAGFFLVFYICFGCFSLCSSVALSCSFFSFAT